MKKLFSSKIALLGTIAVLGLTSCGSNKVNNDKLVIGMETNYQPFNWTAKKESEYTLPIDGTQEFADGYDIAVAKYLSEKTSKEVVIKRMVWDSLIPSLNNGQINMVLAGMTDTAKRREAIDFTDPYLSSDMAFLVRSADVPATLGTKEDPATYEELLNLFSGKTLVCQRNVVCDGYIDTYFVNNTSNITIKHAPAADSYPLAASQVQLDTAFAMPAELPVIEAMTNLDTSALRVLYCDYKNFLNKEDQNGLSVSIGLKKGNDELKEVLNNALHDLSTEKREEMMGLAAQRSAEGAKN